MTDIAPTPDKKLRDRAWLDVVLYGLARLLLFVVLTVVIQGISMLVGVPFPLMISALLALIVAFPLSMFLFKGLRLRVTQELAEWDRQRKEHKKWMNEELSKR
ncbi:DUF4229 domain-containing protein [uncultured Corynebacterium sp.]|uniref:DUF4229 domain-containing protein n=1 Tax=uncultured Corynebacterium sp. TaxID=159447 RepID=UPI0026192EF1|nr:DUF4229 domain-containing protein [uncultured Corynebacterium sp.]